MLRLLLSRFLEWKMLIQKIAKERLKYVIETEKAKRVEIYASRNKIIDEKSLIKKYQREISSLKEELDHLRRGVLVGVSHEEILEEGQVKMQSKLEEEEEAKAALMSRIQRLTKLILVSTNNVIPVILSDAAGHQRSHSAGDDNMFTRMVLCLGKLRSIGIPHPLL